MNSDNADGDHDVTEAAGRRQRITVFQQAGKAESKIAGIYEYGQGRFSVNVIALPDNLPPVIDDTERYLPEAIAGDLVLDYLVHPDLSCDLVALCEKEEIPIVASGKKNRNRWVIAPPICCALPHHDRLGLYGERFGAPAFAVTVGDGWLETITVLRGAPCGATWRAAERIRGLPVEEAVVRMGLETQFFCTADPAGWDPIGGKSPVHFAGELHAAALRRALKAGRGN